MLKDVCVSLEIELKNRDADAEAMKKYKFLKREMIDVIGHRLVVLTNQVFKNILAAQHKKEELLDGLDRLISSLTSREMKNAMNHSVWKDVKRRAQNLSAKDSDTSYDSDI